MFSGKNVKVPMINYDLKWIAPPLWRLSYISSVTTQPQQPTTLNCSQINGNLVKSCIKCRYLISTFYINTPIDTLDLQTRTGRLDILNCPAPAVYWP